MLPGFIRKRIIGGYSRISPFEPADFVSKVTGGDLIRFPFLNDFHSEGFSMWIVILPKFNCTFGKLCRVIYGHEGVFAK
jgi:hypothetical protein